VDDENFRYFMDFIRFLESQALSGVTADAAMSKLAAGAAAELTGEQRTALLTEFPKLG